MKILPLKPALCEQAAALHLLHLSTPFQGAIGRKLLSKYYETISTGHGAAGYAAHRHGELVGYVCGIWDAPDLHRALVRRYGHVLAWWGLRQMVSNPTLAKDLVYRFHRRQRGDEYLDPNDAETYELRPIVVSPAVQGSGVAARLVERLLADAISRGFRKVYLLAEPDNHRARKFYEKIGFRLVGWMTSRNTEFLRFELLLPRIEVCHDS